MKNITELESFVKRQIRYHERQAYRLRIDPEKEKMHTDYRQHFESIQSVLSENEALKREVEELKTNTQIPAAITSLATDHSVLTAADLIGLPPELLAQLNVPEQDEQEKIILSILAENGGIISLDKLLIGLWRKNQQVVPQKKNTTTKLYRMIAKKLIYKVPGKRGLYTTEPMPDSPDEQEEDDAS